MKPPTPFASIPTQSLSSLPHASKRISSTSQIPAQASALPNNSNSGDQRTKREEKRTALARPMDASPSSPSSPSSLKNKLRTTVCCCFGGGAGAAGGERVRWRRRAAVGDFRYDSLSYALNFDEGEDDDDAGAAFRYRNFNSRLPPSPKPAQRPIAIA